MDLIGHLLWVRLKVYKTYGRNCYMLSACREFSMRCMIAVYVLVYYRVQWRYTYIIIYVFSSSYITINYFRNFSIAIYPSPSIQKKIFRIGFSSIHWFIRAQTITSEKWNRIAIVSSVITYTFERESILLFTVKIY